MLEKNQNTILEESQDLIPPQYRGMSSEIVEELWQNPIYIDEEKNKSETERRQRALDTIKQGEIDRETLKTQQINERYASLSADQKADFPNAQKESSQSMIEHIQGVKDIESLSSEEAYVLQKLRSAYEGFKKDNPDKPFNFKLQKDIDQSVYNNLVQRLSFKVLENKQVVSDQEEANKIRENLGIPQQEVKTSNVNKENNFSQQEQIEDRDYQEFRVKNGETDEGVFWYEYRNSAAKKLEKAGKFKWGEERIYFDIPTDNMEELRDLAFIVANEEKIPIAFKYLDLKKTHQVNLREGADTTRFVANFCSVEDAKRFYQALQQRGEYKKMKSDRNLDYHGLNLDNVAYYGSGYREYRESLKRIVETARKNNHGSYTYNNVDGSKEITISEEEYNNFANKYKLMPNLQEVWNNASTERKK